MSNAEEALKLVAVWQQQRSEHPDWWPFSRDEADVLTAALCELSDAVERIRQQAVIALGWPDDAVVTADDVAEALRAYRLALRQVCKDTFSDPEGAMRGYIEDARAS